MKIYYEPIRNEHFYIICDVVYGFQIRFQETTAIVARAFVERCILVGKV